MSKRVEKNRETQEAGGGIVVTERRSDLRDRGGKHQVEKELEPGDLAVWHLSRDVPQFRGAHEADHLFSTPGQLVTALA